MAVKRKRRPQRKRIGRVSYYFHHGSWWVYYLDGERQVRRRTGPDENTAEAIAAQVNAQLATAAPTMFSFSPLTVSELCQQFLDHRRADRGDVAGDRVPGPPETKAVAEGMLGGRGVPDNPCIG